ncbi:MAG: glycosyltransferase [Mycobacteriales bacterium]
MRAAVISTYPPRPCGIATFSRDLRCALEDASADVDVDIVSIVRNIAQPDEPEVAARIRQDVRGDYPAAARTLAGRGTDVVIIEHEYGIFGGDEGSYVVSLADELSQPVVVTLHTVLSQPSVRQAETLRALCERATLITVFTETARRMVIDAHLAPPERVRVVPHGGPSALLPENNPRRSELPATADSDLAAIAPRPVLRKLDGRRVLSTFGLISAGKGIEVAIKALPAIVEKHPEVLYLVAGQTHPEVVNLEGERYRLELERLVEDLGMTDNVHFLDKFLTVDELAVLLGRTDIYVTPYLSREQIVSGALTFAVVAGCPVVSTPYYYAEDLLSSGAGVLVPFSDPGAMADAINTLLDDDELLAETRRIACEVGGQLSWPSVGVQMADVLREAIQLGGMPTTELAAAVSSPDIRPDHLLTLVDDVGIIQHADGVWPHRESGYCVDDVARLVIVSTGLYRTTGDVNYRRINRQALGFLLHAWDRDALGMRNFMSYERQWLDEPHTGDHLGRTVWALGVMIATEAPLAVRTPAYRMLAEMVPAIEALDHPRSVAFCMLGLAKARPEVLGEPGEKLLRHVADNLSRMYVDNRSDDWQWFDDKLTYDNARMPQALIAAGRRLRDETLVQQGREALEWYAVQCGIDTGTARFVGHLGRRRGETDPETGDEQPLEAAALVEAYVEALKATGDRACGRRAIRAFEWFLGRNRLGIPVYDFSTGGCHDGLGPETFNENQGAESTLAYLQALHALDDAGLQASLPRQ